VQKFQRRTKKLIKKTEQKDCFVYTKMSFGTNKKPDSLFVEYLLGSSASGGAAIGMSGEVQWRCLI